MRKQTFLSPCVRMADTPKQIPNYKTAGKRDRDIVVTVYRSSVKLEQVRTRTME